MLSIEELWKVEKLVMLVGASFVGIYMLFQSDFSAIEEPGTSISLIFYLFTIVAFLGITLFPYLIFYQFAKAIKDRKAGITYSRGSLIISLFVMPVSCCLYFASGKSIEGDPGSTASLIFAVLPFYIVIVGGFFYGPVYVAARRDT